MEEVFKIYSQQNAIKEEELGLKCCSNVNVVYNPYLLLPKVYESQTILQGVNWIVFWDLFYVVKDYINSAWIFDARIKGPICPNSINTWTYK